MCVSVCVCGFISLAERIKRRTRLSVVISGWAYFYFLMPLDGRTSRSACVDLDQSRPACVHLNQFCGAEINGQANISVAPMFGMFSLRGIWICNLTENKHLLAFLLCPLGQTRRSGSAYFQTVDHIRLSKEPKKKELLRIFHYMTFISFNTLFLLVPCLNFYSLFISFKN